MLEFRRWQHRCHSLVNHLRPIPHPHNPDRGRGCVLCAADKLLARGVVQALALVMVLVVVLVVLVLVLALVPAAAALKSRVLVQQGATPLPCHTCVHVLTATAAAWACWTG